MRSALIDATWGGSVRVGDGGGTQDRTLCNVVWGLVPSFRTVMGSGLLPAGAVLWYGNERKNEQRNKQTHKRRGKQ